MSSDFSFLRAAVDPSQGFDLIIVVVSRAAHRDWWTERLRKTRSSVVGEADVIVVHEQWHGRPGNGLGTLNALVQADRMLQKSGRGLWTRLERGDAVGVWHTAGQGKRLYPLPLIHQGDKSRTWLPGRVAADGEATPIRLLEAVLRQTSPFASAGHVWVFWGDQLALPSGALSLPQTDVALLGRGGLRPSQEVWEEENLHQYGILAVAADGTAQQLEKLDWPAFEAVHNQLGAVSSVATSMGSFRMTARVARALCDGYAEELDKTTGAADTDPGWWMPMTLPDSVSRAMVGDDAVDRFLAVGLDASLGLIDMGADAPWWDFGTVQAWWASTRGVLSEPSLRMLLDCPEPGRHGVSVLSDVQLRDGGVAIGCTAPEAKVVGGVAVRCDELRGDIRGIAYGVREHTIDVPRGAVIATDGRGSLVNGQILGDGKADWQRVLPGNGMSWAQMAGAMDPS